MLKNSDTKPIKLNVMSKIVELKILNNLQKDIFYEYLKKIKLKNIKEIKFFESNNFYFLKLINFDKNSIIKNFKKS